MPLVEKSSYTKRPWYTPGAHFETIIPSMFFKIKDVSYKRERLELLDGDFLDLDWLSNNNDRLVILSHGLEGSSERHYMKRPAKFFHQRGWDVLAWNCRGCSGEINRLKRTYHHGDISDISAVVQRALSQSYQSIVMIGYSMGGNMQLKYLGTRGDDVDKRIISSVAFSVPCHLEDSSKELNKTRNRFYEKRFLRKLRKKIDQKTDQFPELKYDWSRINDFSDFNHACTLPVFGFQTEREFFEQARSDVYFPEIKVPTLVVNALNDPMLGSLNYPQVLAEQSGHVWLEMPKYGGHVGFTISGEEFSWMEYRAEEFVEGVLEGRD